MNYGFCIGNRAGWKSIRLRLERFLPELVPGTWSFFHLEDYGRWIGTLTKRLGKFQMVHDVFSGRAAASAAIRSGATKIIFGTYHNCPWLPQKKGVRYFVFSDATMQQLSHLGYSGKKREVSRIGKWIYGTGLRRLAKGGHHFFCMSRWYADALQREHGVCADQITLIPPSVDTAFWRPRDGARKPGPLRVVFIGADFMRKGGDLLLALAAKREFADVDWHLVTKSPPQVSSPRITCYTAFDSDAVGLLNLVQNSDLLVLPTRADCSPIATLEAAACGVPSIVTRIGGIPDLVDDGVSGLLLAQPTLEQLTLALRKYQDSPGLIAAHGQAAREKAVREFDVRVVLEKIRVALAGT